MKKSSVDPVLALEAKMIVALAFRNGPIEDLHSGKVCPTCSADSAYSRISDEEMKGIMKAAVAKAPRPENSGRAAMRLLKKVTRHSFRVLFTRK